MSEEEIRDALEQSQRDAEADAEHPAGARPVEPGIPLIHSYEQTAEAADSLKKQFLAWRSARKRRSEDS
jgi:hypothetical protein